MKKKKIFLRTLIVLILVISTCTGTLFTWVALDTNDSATVADDFLFMLHERRTAEAYENTTTAHFRASQTPEKFDKVMDVLGLPLTYRLNVWRDRTLELSNRSRIRGTLIDLGGQDVKFTVDIVREEGIWKVNGFVGDARNGVGPGAWFKQIPLRGELNEITGETIKIFREGIEVGSMEDFYNYMSTSFTIGITLERLQESYQPYIDANVVLSEIEDLVPVYLELPVFINVAIGFDPDNFETIEDVMVLEGFYPLEPLPVPFKFSYVYEHPEWKLFQFQVQQPTISGLSPDICLQWLLRQKDMDTDQCFDLEQNRLQRGIITFQEAP